MVLCSSARRARETVEFLDPPGEVQVEREIYGASADQLLERLRGLSSDIEVAMLVGHNPAIQELAIALARARPPTVIRSSLSKNAGDRSCWYSQNSTTRRWRG